MASNLRRRAMPRLLTMVLFAGAAPGWALAGQLDSVDGPLVATKVTSRSGDRWRTFTYKSVSYEPVADFVFELPQAVKALL
jgi:hypothetical protein